jgi:Rrf2 family transcriptional regulator, nitric oxide-sensitive transcriptional repressor
VQLTRFSDYSLRVLIFLAHRQGELTTIRSVADAHGISEDHLTKVVQRLSKLGYIRTVRGKNGGIGAARPAADISLGQVIRHIEPMTPVECFLPNYEGGCLLYPNCALRGALQSAQLQYVKTLDAYSVADVMGSLPLGEPQNAVKRLQHVRPRPP